MGNWITDTIDKHAKTLERAWEDGVRHFGHEDLVADGNLGESTWHILQRAELLAELQSLRGEDADLERVLSTMDRPARPRAGCSQAFYVFLRDGNRYGVGQLDLGGVTSKGGQA